MPSATDNWPKPDGVGLFGETSQHQNESPNNGQQKRRRRNAYQPSGGEGTETGARSGVGF